MARRWRRTLVVASLFPRTFSFKLRRCNRSGTGPIRSCAISRFISRANQLKKPRASLAASRPRASSWPRMKIRLALLRRQSKPCATRSKTHTLIPPAVVVVFDEASYEFVARMPDTLRYVRAGRNVVTLRTFSKIHGLASLRVGYGIAPPELIEVMHKTRQPFNVSGIGQVAALAALADEDHQRETKRLVDEGRAFFEKEFRAMKLSFVPSAANFVLVKVGDGLAVFRTLLQRKVIVRAMKGYNLPEWIRITIGTMDQNQKCIAALREVL